MRTPKSVWDRSDATTRLRVVAVWSWVAASAELFGMPILSTFAPLSAEFPFFAVDFGRYTASETSGQPLVGLLATLALIGVGSLLLRRPILGRLLGMVGFALLALCGVGVVVLGHTSAAGAVVGNTAAVAMLYGTSSTERREVPGGDDDGPEGYV